MLPLVLIIVCERDAAKSLRGAFVRLMVFVPFVPMTMMIRRQGRDGGDGGAVNGFHGL